MAKWIVATFSLTAVFAVLLAVTVNASPPLSKDAIKKTYQSEVPTIVAGYADMIKSPAVAVGFINYGTEKQWRPFFYLVRKAKTKVSEISTKMLHLDPGLRGC